MAAKNLGVARFITDKPLDVPEDGALRHVDEPRRHLGRQHVAGGSGAILPNKITSKHNFRYVPNMDGIDITKKQQDQLLKTT